MSTFASQLEYALLLLASCLVASCGSPEPSRSVPAPSIDVVPIPRDVTAAHGEHVLRPDATVWATGVEPTARYFVGLVNRTRSASFATSDESASPIHFKLETVSNRPSEGYSLVVTPERIVVAAGEERGLFYGAITLWQLIASAGEEIRLPAMSIEDAPRFRWRGLMLDSARHYQSPEFIKRFIDAMATHKLNVLHWHLTDDQAWRLEIKKYPRLTQVAAWRVPAAAPAHPCASNDLVSCVEGRSAAADIDAASGASNLYGGFYSQDDVKDIVAYAAARHITIVPEIEMPGHASAPITAYPSLGVQDATPRASPATRPPSDWGVYPNLYSVEESTFAFLEDVLTEVIALFPGEYVHVGGDEAVKDQWRTSPRVQARMRELGIRDEHALQSYFIQRIEKFLNAHGRRMIGWDEILEGGLAPNATVMSWRGIDGAIAAARAGHDAVLSPHPTLYFDNRPFPAPVPGRGPVISIEDVYRFDPAPAALGGSQRKHILGVQANIWTEHIRTERRVEYMTFPRAAALAEIAWSAHDRLDWADFSRRLPAQLARYRALGIGFADAADGGRATDDGKNAARLMSHDLTLCSKEIALSLEDDAPVHGERAVFLVDIMNPCWKLPDVDLAQAQRLEVAVGQVPFNFQIGEQIHEIELRAPETTAGELQVRLGCGGEVLSALSLAPALVERGVTVLPAVVLPARAGRHELCFQFTQAKLDPMWVLHTVEIAPATPARAAESS